MTKLLHFFIGLIIGVLLTIFVSYLYIEKLKLEVVDDIQNERDFIVDAYKPALDMLTTEERAEWASSLPKRKVDPMCKYLDSLCDSQD